MASEYLRKSIADRRTGANLIGINVDTSNMREFNPVFGASLEAMEKFARETDEMKIEMEKEKIKLDIEKNILDFKNNHLKDNTVYNSQEKWDEVSRLYEEERKNAKKRISESRYLSADEKVLYAEEMKNTFARNWADPIQKRSGAVIRERINEANILIDMITDNAIMESPYKKDVLGTATKGITKVCKELIKRGIQTESDMNYILANKLGIIETERLKNDIKTNVMDNPNFPTAESKIAEIEKTMKYLESDERLDEVMNSYNFDDNQKLYFKTKLKKGYVDIKQNLTDKINDLKIKQQEKAEKIYNNKVKAYNRGDFYDYLVAEKGYEMRWDDILDTEVKAYTSNSKENSLVYQVTGKTISQINKNGEYVKNLIPSEKLDTWRKDVRSLMDKGYSKFNATFQVLTPVLSKCDEETAQAIINTMAVEDGEYTSREYSYILEGIKDPENKEFKNAIKINSVIEKGGKPNNTQMAIARQIPSVNSIAEKIVESSNGNISYNKALQTTISLALGINARDGVVPMEEVPENVKQQAEFLMHILTDKNYQVVKTLQREFGNENFIEIIADMKSDNNILLPVSFKKGDK